MPATIADVRADAALIGNETQIGGNTASRVGNAFNDVADAIEGATPSIINDLTTGGATNVLSAEQGKKLGQAMSLVVDILKSGVYTADKSTEIDALEEIFDNYVDVTKSLTNVSVSPDVSTVAKGTSLTLTFTPSASHVIDSATVTMGGVSQAVTIAQDQKSATCIIASVSGDIAITATASYVEQELIDSATKLTGKGMTVSSYGNLVTDASYDCYIVPLDFGKWYHLTGYDWKDKGGTATAFNMALVTSDGNDGYTNIKSTALTSSIFTNNNAIFTIGSTNSNIFFNTSISLAQSSILFATPTSAELTGVSDIYLAVNTRFNTVDISSDMSLKQYTPKALYDADDVIKYLGAIYPTYNLTGRSTDYDCVIFKADKGATYSYTGMDWQSKSGTGVAFVVGLLKNVGNLFDNLKNSDFVSGASWLSQDTFFTKTSNIVKASSSANGTFTIPEDTDLTDDVELYVIMNTRFSSVSVTEDISTTKE